MELIQDSTTQPDDRIDEEIFQFTNGLGAPVWDDPLPTGEEQRGRERL
jgi:hypothetical protein